MKFPTNDRELVCLYMALSGAQPETSHRNRKQKVRAFQQLQLDPRIEELASPGGAMSATPLIQWPTAEVVVDLEAGTKDYLIEKYGADGVVAGGAYVERVVCQFIDRLRAAE